MTLETLELYLDGALDAPQTKAVQAAIASDDVLAARVQRLKSQRSLRAAALSTYSPTTDESRMLAMTAIDACYDEQSAPVGRVGSSWMKRLGAVAAALLIAAGSFYAGQVNGKQNQIAGNSDSEKTVVVIKDRNGNILEEKTFNGMQEAQDYVAKMSSEQPEDTPTVEETQISGNLMM